VATIGDSSKLQIGQDVLAIGNPLGITQTVTNGIISALNRSVNEGQGGAILPNVIQTDAPINPGNSGGALVDLQGNLIGIPTMAAIDPEFNTPANGVGFAIPSNRVNFIVPQIIANGHVTHTGRAALGISGLSVDPTLAAQDNLSVDHGVLIANVVSGGAADHAGLQTGDVIVQIDNTAISDESTLIDVLANKNPGHKVTVKVYRGNQQLTVNVTLGELQSGS
jgi:S1-C subfamily serine protease